MIANELESSFGGIYTAIASDIQMPLVENAISALKIEGMEDIDIIITAGVEALGRNVEQAKLERFIANVGQLAQVVGEQATQALNVDNIVYAMLVNNGIGNKEYVKTLNEIEAESQAQQQAQLEQQMMMQGANSIGQQAGAMVNPQQGGM